MSDTAHNWRATGVADALAKVGRPVLAMDARGHGLSDKPTDPAAYGEDRMATDVIELVDHFDVGTFDLVGYSMGAAVALLVTARDGRVRRLVLGGLGGAVVEGGFAGLSTAAEAVAEALEADDPATIEEPVAASFRRFADAVGADRRALAAHVRAPRPSKVPLEGIAVPTLVMAGHEDRLAPDAERLAAVIPGARHVATGGDHLKAVGTPEFRNELVAFLSDQTETSSPR